MKFYDDEIRNVKFFIKDEINFHEIKKLKFDNQEIFFQNAFDRKEIHMSIV